MESGKGGLVVVFPAIIAVLRCCESDTANTAKAQPANNNTSGNVPVIQKASLEEIETAILLSLTTNDWIIRGQAESTLSADLWDGVETRRVLITYDDESISIEDLSTNNGGNHPTPVSAIRNLMNDIQRNLLAGVLM